MFTGIAFSLFGQGLQAQVWKQYKDSADIYIKAGNSEKALSFYLYARTALQKDSANTLTYSRVCKSAGLCNYSLSKYQEAASYLEEARSLVAKISGKQNAGYTSICNALAVSYQLSGKSDTAKSIYLENREIRANMFGRDTSEAYAQSCNNLAALYRDMGEYNQAEQLTFEAVAIRKKNKEKNETSAEKYAITIVSLANLYRDMGQYENAEKFYLEAKSIRAGFEPAKQSMAYASSCNILADLYTNYTVEYEKALPLYLEAKSIRTKEKSKWQYAETCSNLGALYRNMGQFELSGSLLLEANEIYQQFLPQSIDNLTINFNNLGELYYKKGEYEKAISYYLKARTEWQKNLDSDHPYLIANTDELAKAYWGLNETGKADELIQEAVTAKYDQLNKIFQFTNEKEKQLYLKNINGSSDEYQSFYFAKSDAERAGIPYMMSLLNRNLTLSSARQIRQIIYNSHDTTLLNVFDQWQQLKLQLAQLYSRGENTGDVHIKEIEEKAGLLEKILSRKSAAFNNLLQKPASWQFIQQHLKPGEASVEFISFNFFNGERFTDSIYYRALILRNDVPEPVSVNLFEEKQLDSLLRISGDNSATINNFYSRGLKITSNNAISGSVYNLVWKPLESKLRGINKIYFAPSGLLHRIAFAALPSEGTHRLSEKYQLVQLSTTASIPELQEETLDPRKNLYLVGGVQYGKPPLLVKRANGNSRSLNRDGFTYLPGTETEVNEIADEAKRRRFPARILKGYSAQEDSIKALSGFSSPQVLHIATHGFFFPDPASKNNDSLFKDMVCGRNFRQSPDPLLRSGLLFAGANRAWCGDVTEKNSDGILTAYEVASLYLPGTKLVVLSACETALGDIEGSEGVYGLQRSFKMAGVKNIIMSLWKVPDVETAEFMKIFYQKMFDGGTIDNSFYATQAAMRKKYESNSYKWAAWILIR